MVMALVVTNVGCCVSGQTRSAAGGCKSHGVLQRCRVVRRARTRLAAIASDQYISIEEIKRAAEARGLELSMSTVGPFFKVRCFARGSASQTDENIIAEADGFTAAPFGILHLDSMRVYNSRIKAQESERAQSPFGVGLLVGALAVRAAWDVGCRKAELLAIKDNDLWHAKLVRYYTRLGFEAVREVGDNGVKDFPDLVVWGGVGTRMDARIEPLLARWSAALRRERNA